MPDAVVIHAELAAPDGVLDRECEDRVEDERRLLTLLTTGANDAVEGAPRQGARTADHTGGVVHVAGSACGGGVAASAPPCRTTPCARSPAPSEASVHAPEQAGRRILLDDADGGADLVVADGLRLGRVAGRGVGQGVIAEPGGRGRHRGDPGTEPAEN